MNGKVAQRRGFARWGWLLAVLVLLAGTMVGCGGNALPANTLIYNGPAELGVNAGKFLPGTNIKYVGVENDKAHFDIGEMPSLKLRGDSITWSGKFNQNVQGDLSLRLLLFDKSAARLAGTVKVVVRNAKPVRAVLPEKWTVAYGVPVSYDVKVGENIPGTTITYVGKDDKGAQIGGVSDYPYRQMADSITWAGHPAAGANLKLVVRVVYFSATRLRLAGIATIGVP